MFPPSPIHILRGHCAQVNVLSFSTDNERLYSGDSFGQVTVTSTLTLRPLASWKAHSDGILGIQEWKEDTVITHGRDHKLHVWTRIQGPTFLAETAATPTLPLPLLSFTMDVNALNYCRFSLLLQCESSSNALLALPNLIESSLADIWVIPSVERLHAAIGHVPEVQGPGDGRGINKTGIIMSLHLYQSNHASSSTQTQLRLILAYENGSVSLFAHGEPTETSVEGRGWDNLWTVKFHVEAVMSMTVRRDNVTAFTVSADNLICRYQLEDKAPEAARSVYRTKYPGNGAIAVRVDGRVLAVGGWDGRVRLYSTKTLNSLGTLAYHKEGCYAVAFASQTGDPKLSGEDADCVDSDGIEIRSRWLATGGKDSRIAIWQLIDFDKKKLTS